MNMNILILLGFTIVVALLTVTLCIITIKPRLTPDEELDKAITILKRIQNK